MCEASLVRYHVYKRRDLLFRLLYKKGQYRKDFTMMSPISVLSVTFLLIGTIFGQEVQQGGYKIGTATKQGLDLIQNTVKFGTSMTQEAINHGTDFGKKAMDTTQKLGTQALKGGTDLAKEGLELVNTITGGIPVVRYPVKYATGIAQWLLNFGNTVGGKAIKAGTDLGGNAMEYIKKMSELTTGSIQNLSNGGTTLTKESIDNTVKILGDAVSSSVQTAKDSIPSGIVPVPQPVQ